MATWRAFQTVGLAFLFVPNSTIAYSSLPRSLNADAAALYAMFRNIAGSIGISAAAAITAHRLQVHRAHLAAHLTPFDQSYVDVLDHAVRVLRAAGQTAGQAQYEAMGLVSGMLTQQAAVLAYVDAFALSAVAAFCAIPLTFLFRAGTAGGRGR
jgi:MFS transporter, DHA2 family, multidrug resistance protein